MVKNHKSYNESFASLTVTVQILPSYRLIVTTDSLPCKLIGWKSWSHNEVALLTKMFV